MFFHVLVSEILFWFLKCHAVFSLLFFLIVIAAIFVEPVLLGEGGEGLQASGRTCKQMDKGMWGQAYSNPTIPLRVGEGNHVRTVVTDRDKVTELKVHVDL